MAKQWDVDAAAGSPSNGGEFQGSPRMGTAITSGATFAREQMQAKLETLKKEFETGQAELEKVEQQRAYLRETLLRISGAAQVLEELLADGPPTESDGAVGPG